MTVTENRMDQYIKVPTKENEKTPETTDTAAHFGYGIRHTQLVMFFICLSMSFIARGHLGVTLVAMTNHQHAISDTKNTTGIIGNITEKSILRNDTVGPIGEDGVKWTIYTTYNWPKPIQETVLSSFFLGYCIMMFPIALVCQRWGGKVPLQISLLINGLVSLLTPWLTLLGGWKALCACRIMQGLSQAGTYPGIQTLLAKWVPINERATLSSYVYTGTTVGNIIGFQISGILAESAWGWPSTFWAIGLLSLICFFLLTIFGASTPLAHKTISEAEKSYITGKSYTSVGIVQRRQVPWKAILTSTPVWANFAAHVGSGVSFIFFFTQVPSYIHYILGVDVKSSGILSSLPYFASFFTSVTFGLISDYFTNRKIISVKQARRIFNSISQVGVALGLICASFTTNTIVAVLCFTVTMGCHMGIHTGWMLNHIDLAPNYSGTLMALGNTLMNIFAMILPVLVSNIVVDVRNASQWRTMLFLVAGVSLIANIVFVIFLSVEVQPWNEGQIHDAESDNSSKTSIKEKEPIKIEPIKKQ